MTTWIFIALGFLLSSCASMEGAYRGPEKFGRERYDTELPRADLSRKVKVVVLTFSDQRPRRPGMDWTRQAEVTADSVGQPDEVRLEVEKAITAGLAKHPKIELMAAEEFLKTRDADVVISGKILRCEAQRQASDFVGFTVLEVSVRDQFGNAYWTGPLRVRSSKKVEYKDSGYFDEIEPGKVAAAVSDSIEAAASELLTRRSMVRVLERSQTSPQRSLASEDVRDSDL